jgi:putative ABC transport system permease protein
MIKNYLKIALRNLQKQKVLAFINIFGLSVGIACFSLLLLFIINEFSFDKFHKNAPNIYRVYALWDQTGFGNISNSQSTIVYTDYSGLTRKTLGEAMKEDIPDLVNYVRLRLPWGENLIRTNNKVLRAELGFTDRSFFSIFNFPLKYGSITNVLHDMNDIVLTESRARQLFGGDDVVGKTVEIQIGTAFKPFRISAVAKDIPANSSVRFDVLGSFAFAQANNNNFIIGNNWHPTVDQTYVQLRRGSKLPNDTRQMERFIRTFTPNVIKDAVSAGWKGNKMPVTLKLQPLLSIHTDSWFHGWSFTDYNVIDPKTIWILLAIAAGILLIACINFTTLAIGRSAGRSKEVGVRKVIGAEKKQIIFQFLTEALLLSTVSAILGLLLAKILLPWFNHLSGRELQFSTSLYPQIILLLVGLVLVVGLLAGSYPALVLSNFKPVEVLKNKIRIGGSNLFTKSLVTFQFVLSIILIVATTIILQQTKYLINKNPGFNKENVVAIDASQIDPNKVFPSFKQFLLSYPQIVGVTSAAAGLGAGNDLLGYSDPGSGGSGISADLNVVDPDYIKVLGMHLIAGRNFEPAGVKDTTSQMIINETMMKSQGWNQQTAVGQEIKRFQGKTAVVIGVVKNFNYRPLSEVVNKQAFITSAEKGFNHFYVRIAPGNPASTLTTMQKAWNNAAPGVPMKYSFLDEDVNNYYNSEQRWSGIVGWAGGISIFLACLGLLGLAALAAVNRIKEIGIRKVLGASVLNITNLLLTDFLKLIFIAFLVASPLAWYFMSKWLQDYAYRISISWTVFLLAGLFAIVIAVLTISFQAIKAALMNPVKSLRSE